MRLINRPIIAVPPLLSVVGTAAAGAWSISRRLASGYSGSLIRVRRASDNGEDDFGLTPAGVLNAAALASFCAATDGFITSVYDQSGNARDLAQATTTVQPQIVASGAVITGARGLGCLRLDGVDDDIFVSRSVALPITWMAVLKSRAWDDEDLVLCCGSNARGALRQETGGSVQRYKIHSGSALGAIDISTDAWNVVRAHFNATGTDDSIAINADSPTTGSAGDNTPTSYRLGHPTLCAAADVHEHVVWEANLSAADEAAAYANMMQFYGIS